jgi:hypothetical protein
VVGAVDLVGDGEVDGLVGVEGTVDGALVGVCFGGTVVVEYFANTWDQYRVPSAPW